jgi:hypothetical protein
MSWTGLQGALGVMAGINDWVACTFSGGVVGGRLCGTEGEGIGGGLISWRGAWRIGGSLVGLSDAPVEEWIRG